MNLLLSLTRVMGERAAVVGRAVEWFERGSGGSVYKAVNQKNKTLFSECDTVVMFLKYKNNPVGSWANLYEKCTLHPVRCVWPAAALCSHTSRPVQTVTLFARVWEIPYRHWNIITFTQIFTFIYIRNTTGSFPLVFFIFVSWWYMRIIIQLQNKKK